MATPSFRWPAWLAGRRANIVAYMRRQSYRLRIRSPQTAAELGALLAGVGGEPPPSPLRGRSPVDA